MGGSGLRLLLASTSPRRRQLLRAAGLAFDLVEPGHEPTGSAATPAGLAAERARAKAVGAAWRSLPEPVETCEPVVLGVDTVVEWDGREFGKPRTADEARQMLGELAGRQHLVHSALHLWLPLRSAPEADRCHLDTAEVRFAGLDAAALDRFLASGAWQGKAGGYGIQDPECWFAELVAGDLETVIGMATSSVVALLQEVGGRD